MSSERLPGKILEIIHGKPLLLYMIESLEHCSLLDTVVVATSDQPSDEPVADFCRKSGIHCYRGSLTDVAGRFVGVIKNYGFKQFVRVCGDSPLLDYRLVDRAVRLYFSGSFDMVTNVLKRTFPKGQSVEVMKSDMFVDSYPKLTSQYEHEHVTAYFYNNLTALCVHNFESERNYAGLQLSVDTKEDMHRIKMLVGSLARPHWQYTLENIVHKLYKQENTGTVR